MARLVVWRAQDRRRVNGREDEWRERRRHELAAMRGDLELTAEQRLGRRGAQADDRLRLHERDLGVEPRPTRRDFARVGLLVNAPLPARLPFEVLDDVGDVDNGAIDARFAER